MDSVVATLHVLVLIVVIGELCIFVFYKPHEPTYELHVSVH